MAKVVKKEEKAPEKEEVKNGMPTTYSVDEEGSKGIFIPEEDETEEEELDETEETEDGDDETVDYKALFEEQKSKNDKLLEQVNELSGKKDVKPNAAGDEKELDNQNTFTPPAAVRLLEEAEFDDDTFTEVLTNKKAFIDKMNEFGNKIRAATVESVMKDIPGIVQNISSFTVEFNELNRQFFERYPQLAPVKRFVSAAADEMLKERNVNDLAGYEKVLEDLPKVIEEKLGISLESKKKGSGSSSKKPKAGQVAPGGQRRGKGVETDLSPLEADFKRSLEYSKRKRGVS